MQCVGLSYTFGFFELNVIECCSMLQQVGQQVSIRVRITVAIIYIILSISSMNPIQAVGGEFV